MSEDKARLVASHRAVVFEGWAESGEVVVQLLRDLGLEPSLEPGVDDLDVVTVQVPLESAQRARLLLHEVAPYREPPAATEIGGYEETERDATLVRASVRRMVASGEPKGVAAVKANGRGQIWGPIFLLYLAMQGVYFFARDCDGPIANGALFPIFVLLGGALYLWGLDRLDPVTRLIYREATRTAIEKRWWPPIMSVLAGAVFLAMTVVTVGETRSAWVTPVMFLISMSLLGAGATVIARKIKRLRVPKDTALIADRPRR